MKTFRRGTLVNISKLNKIAYLFCSLASGDIVEDIVAAEEPAKEPPELTIEELKSPLTYNRAGDVNRISLIDKSSPPFEKHDSYFDEITKQITYNRKTGKIYKKPKVEVTPGAAPGTVAFLDYHTYIFSGEKYVYIDYMKTRRDMRGQGHARLLINYLKNKFGTNSVYDFGKVMTESVWKMKKELDAAGYQTLGKIDF